MTDERGLDPGSARGHSVLRWRVLLGAALITIAAAGVVFAHRASQQPPTTRYLVVTEDVEAGEVVSADMLGSVPIDLPSSIDAMTEDRSDEVLGRVAARSLAGSSLVTHSDFAEPEQFLDPNELLVTATVDGARLRRSSIAPGRTVHVLADRGGRAATVATARVSSIGETDDAGLGDGAGVQVELAVTDMAVSEAITTAALDGSITLVVPSPAANGES
ncbi:MAG: SAF domain-containing protein [Microthrixaceae bacterium]